MPELPEVETVVRDLLRSGVVKRTVRSAHVLWHRTVSGMSPDEFGRQITGRRILAVERRAKYVVMRLSEGLTLLIHLRMSGRLGMAHGDAPDDPHVRVWLRLDGGSVLVFSDTRKFGRWVLTNRPERILDRIGPEPLSPDFTRERFARALEGSRRMLKPLLLDQTFLAGLGNIYVDEALWHARLHPCRSADSLRPDEARGLHQAIRSVLRQAIRLRGTSLGEGRANFRGGDGRHGENQERLQVFHRAGLPCPRCGTPISRCVVGQRGTHLCAACQRPRGGTRFRHGAPPRPTL